MAARWKPNVTVAAIASRPRGGVVEYLLVEEKTRDGLRLNNPAGHLDAGESLLAAVCRETLEETARAFVPSHLVGVYRVELGETGGVTTYLRFAIAGQAGDADPSRPLDAPVVRTLWLTLDEARACVPRHRSPLVLRCLEDAAAGRAYPLDVLVEAGR